MEEVGFMEKYKLTPQKIGKVLILGSMVLLLVWSLLVGFDKLTFSAKKLSKSTGDASL